jgi:hypothetical protein
MVICRSRRQSSGPTRVQFPTYGQEEITRVVKDETYPDSLSGTLQTIIDLSEAAC